MINIDALNDEEKLAALESIHKSIAESKEIQRKKITTNVEMIVKALKKIEADLKQRYDETGQLIANLKSGEDGRDGKDGKDGKNGKDGRDGPMGPRGYDGVPGRNGLDGTDGVSVTDAHIDFDGSLIISLSSGRVINVGEVVAADIAEKIKVITNGGGTSQSVLDAIASLQAQIDAIASGLEYQGTWNASTNVPTLASSVGTAGYYYIVATAGSTNLNGITDWQIGDWAVFNGSVWQKIDQTNLVTSVAGRTGAIVLTTADIGGLGTIATQAANNVSITGGSITGITDLAIADGGTGASTANAAFNALAPSQTGNSGKYLTTDGTDTSWATNPLGTVTSVSGTGTVNGLTLTGTVTSSGSLTLGGTLSGIANSALTNSSITINGSATSLGGSINVGTVTSVGASVPSFLSIAGSPVTSSGTLAITLSGTALPTTSGGTGLTSFTANGVVYASSTSALATGSALTFDGSKLVNTGYNKSTYQVSTGGIGTFESSGGAYLSYLSGANIYSMSDGSGTEDILNLRASAHLFYINSVEQARLNSTGLGLGTNSPGSKLDVKGTLRLSGSTSGYVGLAPAASAGSTTYTLPSADGTANQALVTNGSGTLSWASTATGTVTSVGGTGTVSGISLSGTVTSSGNLTLGGALDLSAYNGAGAFTTLSASGNVTLSGGTANGVAYLNGSKVVTSGSALTFDGTNLGIGAGSALTNITINGNSSGGFIRGQRAGANQWFVGDTASALGSGTGLINFVYGNDPFIWYNGGTSAEQMRLTSTGLGIGTSSPNGRLEVVGSTGASFNGWFRTGDATAANNAGGGFYNTSSATAASRKAVLALDADGANLGGGDYFTIEKSGNSGVADILQYSNAAIRFGTNFTNRATFDMTLDSSGNLGLGVTPSAWYSTGYSALQVRGSSIYGQAGNDTNLASNAFVNTSPVWAYVATGTASRYEQSAGKHIWYNAPSGTAGNAITFTQAMTLDASGNFMVGATSPLYSTSNRGNITLNGASTAILGLGIAGVATGYLYTDANVVSLGAESTRSMTFAVNGSERARIDSSGNMGVGVTNPSSYGKLAVDGNISMVSHTQTLFANKIAIVSSSGNMELLGGSANIVFKTGASNDERARIDTSGNLMVGTTSQLYGAAGSRLNVDAGSNGGATIKTSGGSAQASIYSFNSATTGDNAFISFGTEATWTERGSITYNRAGGLVVYNTTSDYRAKDISGSVTDSGSVIDSVPVYMGKMKGATQERPMFIAHETPEYAHTGEKDAVDSDGNPVYQQMDASALIPVMWAEIQSLRKRLADAGI